MDGSDYGVDLPLGADRTAEYYLPTLLRCSSGSDVYSDVLQPIRDARPALYSLLGAGGDHPAGGPPTGSAALPVTPYADEPNTPVVRVPRLSGSVEAGPLPSGGSGLTP